MKAMQIANRYKKRMPVFKKSVYIGCALTDAPAEFMAEVAALKDVLRERYEVYDFVGLTNGTSEDVYNWDIGRCVTRCDLFVPICDYPSLGLGWEMCKRVELGKPMLAVAHENAQVSRLVLGAAPLEPAMTFERYADLLQDVPKLIEASLFAK